MIWLRESFNDLSEIVSALVGAVGAFLTAWLLERFRARRQDQQTYQADEARLILQAREAEAKFRDDLSGEVKYLRDEIRRLDGEMRAMRAENAELRSQANQDREELVKTRRELDATRTELEATRLELDDTRTKLAQAQVEIETLKHVQRSNGH